MSGPLEVISVVAAGMVKFALSPLASYKLGFSFGETLLFTSIGGCLGVVFFYRLSGWLMKRARLRRLHRAIAVQHGVVVKQARRVFTPLNRLIVRVKRNQGMRGLAALTPILISIPIGTVIAAKYFRHDRRMLPTMLGSVLVWSVVLSTFWTVAR